MSSSTGRKQKRNAAERRRKRLRDSSATRIVTVAVKMLTFVRLANAMLLSLVTAERASVLLHHQTPWPSQVPQGLPMAAAAVSLNSLVDILVITRPHTATAETAVLEVSGISTANLVDLKSKEGQNTAGTDRSDRGR
jgi:hypothetical protein